MTKAVPYESLNSGALIEARGLRFAYASDAPEVVRGATLAVERGRLSALIGANGSGKSTLVRLLAGLLKPSVGELLFGGVPLAQIDPRLRARRVAYVPQTSRPSSLSPRSK